MKKKILTLLAAVSLLSAVLCGCGGGSQTTPSDGNAEKTDAPTARAAAGEINIGIAQDLDSSLDPHKTVEAGTREVMFNVFEGLLKPNSSGELKPALAESYEVSDDHLLYTVKLRPNVVFHNGQPVTAEDVVWSYRRCGDPTEADVIQVAAFSGVDIYAEDERTVCFRLTTPGSEFASYLTTAVLPRDYTEQDTRPVGTGPFRFVSRAAQESIVLERFDDYWGEKPALTKVTYKIIENADSIVLSLQSGAVDLVAHLTTTQAAQLGEGFHIEEGTMNLVQALYLNNAEKPLDDVRVRQALCYAVDRRQILDLAFDGYGVLLGSSMYPAFGKYFDDTLTEHYEYSPEKAKALLAEAGYPNGFDLAITVPTNYQPHMDTAQVVVEQLKAVGINASIDPVTWDSWVEDTYVGRRFQATLVGVDASNMTARAMLERFVSSHSKNFINYSSAEYDDMFAQAQRCYDDAEQTAIYRAMERDLTENAANVYIQDLADLVAVRDGIEGPEFYPIYVLDLSALRYVS